MDRFYLSDQDGILAQGLYHYTIMGGGVEERFIDVNGRPKNPPRPPSGGANTNIFPLPLQQRPVGITLDDWRAIVPIKPADWLLIGEAPLTYLALHPLTDQQIPTQAWANMFAPHQTDPAGLALPFSMRRHLPGMLWQRYNQGYGQVRQAIENGFPAGFTTLEDGGELFFGTITNVGRSIITRIQSSFFNPTSDEAFSSPEWAFQLNRILVEGFIEGLAFANTNLTKSRHYDVPQDSLDAWEKTVGWVNDAKNIDDFYDPLEPKLLLEQQALDVMADVVNERFNLNFTRKHVLRLIFWLTTPGSSAQEEFAFWYLHFPHWYRDLSNALNWHGKQLTAKNRDILIEIIMTNYPTKGQGLSASDWLIGATLRLAGIVGVDLPDLLTFVVEGVLDDVQENT